MSKLKTFKGIIIDPDAMQVISDGTFIIFGEMDDRTSCYHRIEDSDDSRAWYTRSIQKYNGMTVNLFYIEGFDGNKEEYDDYVENLKYYYNH